MTATSLTTVEQVARHAHLFPDGAALRHDGATVSWRQLLDRARRIAGRLSHDRVRPGERVVLAVSNSSAFVECLLATHLLGAIAAPVNVRLSAPEIAFVISDTDARVVVVDADLLARGVDPGEGRAYVVNDTSSALDTASARPDGLTWIRRTHAPIATEDLPVVAADDVAYLLYTSGTTGRPKGAMLTHANLAAACWISTTMNGLVGRGDVRYVATPLFHIAALSSVVSGLLMGAAAVLTSTGDFDPERLLDVLEAERVTHLFLVPTQWAAVLDSPTLARRDLAIRAISWGAAPLAPGTLARLTEALPGVRVTSTFGQTEMSGVTAHIEGLPPPERAGSVGHPAFAVDVRVVDEQMRDVGPDQVGEAVYRGPTTMSGYWQRPEATAEAFRGGWFHSGDLVRRDADGHLYVVDRLKDMIISGGENIYPAELERVIGEHPKVRETAVIGRPDPKWGETPVAVVVPRGADDPPTHEDIVAWVRTRLASYAKPSSTLLVTELPRNATGKVLKQQLRALIAEPPREEAPADRPSPN